jgi:hypothetical protein
MAVDRGELRYKIAIEDSFTKPITQFRTELLKAKSTLDFVKTSTVGFQTMSRDITAATAALRQFRTTAQQTASTGAGVNRTGIQNLQAAQAQLKTLAQLQKQQAALQKQQAQAANQAATAQKRADDASVRSRRDALKAQKDLNREQERLNRALFGTEKGVNRVAFTFRRLFGILAAFTIAREVVGGFANLITSSVQFNRTIEESRIGLAGLFTALGDVSDAAGNLQKGPDAFATALGIADDQIQKLQSDALKTTATFQQLVEVFQVAVGPGLAAGLQVDEIRQVAVLVSQAASALRISQDQLSEEIRALLTGAGTQRTSRIFTALGFSSKEINEAKAAGDLFKLLETRLRAFGKAAEAAQNTLTGLNQRLSEAISLVSGRAGVRFFDDLKKLLTEVGDLFVVVERNAEGVIERITPRPETLNTLAILFEGLQRAVNILRQGLQEFSLREIQNAVALIADLFSGVATVAVGFVRGLVSGLSDVAVIAEGIFGSFDSEALKEVVALVTRIGTLLAGAGLAVGAITLAFKLLVAPVVIVVNLLDKMLLLARGIFVAISKVPGGLFTWLGIIIAIFAGFGEIFEAILGFPLTIKDVANIFALSFETAFKTIVGHGEIIFKEFANFLVPIFQDPIGQISKLFLDLFSSILQATSGLAALLGISEEFRADIEDAITSLNKLSDQRKAKPIFDTAQDRKELSQLEEDTKAAFDRIAQDIAEREAKKDFNIKPELDEGFTADILNIVKTINAQLTGLIGGDIIDEEAIAEKLNKVVEGVKTGSLKASAQIDEQVLTAFDKLIIKMADSSAAMLNLLTSAVNSFANFAADAIVNAFDPTNDTTIKEQFARFLQGLAKQIIQTILTLLIATAIAKAFGVPLPTDTTPPPTIPGFAEGGSVPGDKAVSIPRPSYIPRSDTVPAWLTPNEFVQTVDAVRRYGVDVMEAIRSGSIDPLALRSLAGLDTGRSIRRSVARSGGMAYADGGLVAATNVQQTRDTIAASEGNAQPPIALVVGNEQSLDRLLAGGKRSMLDFMRQNAGAIDGILSKNRRA